MRIKEGHHLVGIFHGGQVEILAVGGEGHLEEGVHSEVLGVVVAVVEAPQVVGDILILLLCLLFYHLFLFLCYLDLFLV
jgi:hypothetical protein